MNIQSAVSNFGNVKDSVLRIVVVICTHNRPATLERCLQRLLQIDDLSFSVVVVDSAPNSSEARTVAGRYGAGYIVSSLTGLSRARNIGTRASDADIVAYLDDDMVPQKHWLSSLASEFADKDVTAATGPVLPLEFTEGSDVDLLLAVERAPWGPRRFQIDRYSRQWFVRTNFGGIGDGNFAIRRSSFDQIGGFDERLGRGAAIDASEEHFAYFRLVESGFKIAYTPKAIVFHPVSPMGTDLLGKQIADSVAFAAFLAWHHPFRALLVGKFVIEGMFGPRRWWHASSTSELSAMSAKQKLLSGLRGLLIFLQSLR
jgi:GT2 family glycosyltransferase